MFVTPTDAVLPSIETDRIGGPVVTIRQIEEGVATTHFSSAGARLTGNSWLDSAATVVIVGDSYVAAREVPDESTMGAWLERRARSERLGLNVRQYGWRGASPARYVVAAPAVAARWSPSAVVIPLSSDDLDERAVSGSRPYFALDDRRNTVVVGEPEAVTRQASSGGSILGLLIARRWAAVRARAPRGLRHFFTPVIANAAVAPTEVRRETDRMRAVERPDSASIPSLVVSALEHAYGSRLVIVYVADVRVTGGETPDDAETRLLDACRREAVTCASTRTAMVRARSAGVIARGFPTTTLGVGHLNADGHRLLADVVWPLVRPRVEARFASSPGR